MKTRLLSCLLVVSQLFACIPERTLTLESGSLMLSINKQGLLRNISVPDARENFLSLDTLAPLLSIRVENEMLYPKSASYDKEGKTITLYYENEIDIETGLAFRSSKEEWDLDIRIK